MVCGQELWRGVWLEAWYRQDLRDGKEEDVPRSEWLWKTCMGSFLCMKNYYAVMRALFDGLKEYDQEETVRPWEYVERVSEIGLDNMDSDEAHLFARSGGYVGDLNPKEGRAVVETRKARFKDLFGDGKVT